MASKALMRSLSPYLTTQRPSEPHSGPNLQEGLFLNIGAGGLIAKIKSLDSKIKSEKDVSKKMNLISRQSVYLSALIFAVAHVQDN